MSPSSLAWVVVALFTLTTICHHVTNRYRVAVGVLAWGGFAAFWIRLLPRFAFGMHSVVETVGAVVTALASVLVATRLYTTRDDRLFQLTEALAVAGGVYLAAATIPVVRATLIETVASQTHTLLGFLGFDPILQPTDATGHMATLAFTGGTQTFTTHLVFACTGIGAMAAFTGVVTAVDASRRRRVATLTVLVALIWGLNLGRNVFIAAAFGDQWFQLFVPTILAITGYTDPGLVSYVIADRLIAQTVSVLAVIGLCAIAVHLLPSLKRAVTELVAVLTGDPDPGTGRDPPTEGVTGD